jgi:hypothetical protein
MILMTSRFLRLVEVEGTIIIWSKIMNNRRNPAPPAATLDINCDCKEYVIDYLAKSFPVRLMAVFTDENGNPRSEPMSDEQGAPVQCAAPRWPRATG